MNKLFFSLLLYLSLCPGYSQAQGYDIRIMAHQMPGKNIILAHYYDGKVYSADTAKLNTSGSGYFKNSKKKLAKGVYLLFFSPGNYFDLIIGDNQNFSIKTDTLNILETIQFEGSPENTAFLNFQKLMVKENQETHRIREEYNKDPKKDDPEIKKSYASRFDAADHEIRSFIVNLTKEFPGSAATTFANLTLTPITPDFSKEIPEGSNDRDMEIQRRSYHYNKSHYWDYTYFSDSTILRTPIFKSKLDNYFNKMLLLHPDTVYNACINLIEKSRKNQTVFRYMVGYCFNFTLDSKIMGMDAAFVNIAKKYYLSKEASWVDQENLRKIGEEVMKLQYNLIGLTAPELKLPTMDSEWVSLHETQAPFTLLLFWESNCGHCKKQVPLVKTALLDRFKPYGLKVFAVHTQNKQEEWEKFVQEHDLFDYINCWDPYNQSNYRVYYNVYTTPVMYLLDKDKKIIAKKLDVEQLADMLQREYKRMGIEVKSANQ